MFSIVDQRFQGNRYQGNRREILRIGTTSIGGFSLWNLLVGKSQAAVRDVMHDRSIVVLNLQGGPTQFETFDPKMSAPREMRSITGELQTSIPGVTFGGGFPELAKRADRLAVVRSYRHGISSHGPAALHVMAGGNPTGAMMGSLFARCAGLTNEQTGMPQNALVTSHAISKDNKDLYTAVSRVSDTGTLPSSYRPFDPSAGGEIIDNMRLKLDGARLGDRRQLLGQLDILKRRAELDGSLKSADTFRQQAFDVLTRGVANAFDLSLESPETVERYDTSHFQPTESVKERNSYAAQFSPVALGKQMLLSRRLCEAGCGFVTVTCGGWDMHGGGKEFTMRDGLDSLSPAVDRAVSAFLDDLADRGLDKKILLVITGEFGRTPRINKNGGRDHWGNLCTLAFAGGGLNMGQVIGKSDKTGSSPASDPVSSQQLLATVMHTLFDIGQLRLQPGIPQDVERVVTAGQPIPGLF
jgi:hypothetical protein